MDEANALKSRQCPNCLEPNRPGSQFCSRCRIVLSLDSYNDVLKRQKEKDLEIKQIKEHQSNEMNKFKEDMENKFQQILQSINVAKVMERE